jgi:hypothetical protein
MVAILNFRLANDSQKPKPQNRFEPNMTEMFIGWSYTRFLFFGADRKPNMAARAHNVF